jgi:hypothetical protein
MKFQDRCFAYIHGRYDSDSYVFRESEYKAAYNDTEDVTGFLKDVIGNYPVLFFGFSFEDEPFKQSLKEVIEKIKKDIELKIKIHGPGSVDEHGIKGLFVILQEKLVDYLFTKEELEGHIGTDLSVVESYLKIDFLNANGASVIFKPKKNIVEAHLAKIIKGNAKNLIDEIKLKIKAKERVEYLNNLNFEILRYTSGNHIEAIDLLKDIKIVRSKIESSNNLPTRIER